jgi:uncharacterized protein (TIGR02118 family)
MLKVVWLLNFRSDMDPDEVRRWWREDHAALALKAPGIERYVQNHWIDSIEDTHAMGMPYQGMVEVWFESYEAYQEALASPEWKALAEDAPYGFEMDSLRGGFVNEYVLR